jgi:hypothetical protein
MDEPKTIPDGRPIVQVRIINRNPFTIRDAYNGVQYVFPGSNDPKNPSKPVQCNPEVAAHIFGWRQWPGTPEEQIDAMVRYCAIRHGWNRPQLQEQGKDREYFDNIEIVPVRLKLIEETDERRKA